MRVAHLLAEEGITGELWLGALLDAGADPDVVRAPLERAGVDATLRWERREVRAVACTVVRFDEPDGARRVDTYPALLSCIEAAGLPDRARRRAHAVATALARAEADVHATPIEAVHFHELGRPRTVARVIAGAAALEALDVDHVSVGRVAVGGGQVRIAHGAFPVPPPAVLHLLRGHDVVGGPQDRELTTPSGAAVLAALAAPQPTIPPMRLEAHGRGAIEDAGDSQLLTVLVGDAPCGQRHPIPL